MSRSSLIISAMVAIALIAVATPQADASISCAKVAYVMFPCISYLNKNGPLGSCCGGVEKLNAAATTTPDRQTACRCLKNLAKNLKTLNYGKVAGLPGTCGVNIPYVISPSTDCSRVK